MFAVRLWKLFLALGVVCVLGGTALANEPGRPGTAIVRGKCTKLIVSGKNFTADCKGEAASITQPNGAILFVFSIRTGGMFSFQGDGRKVKGNSNGARLPVNIVHLADQAGELLGTDRASGSCQFGDPYQGRATISCSAKSKQFGSMSASFITNGKPPLVR
jgi:hypothetical protein